MIMKLNHFYKRIFAVLLAVPIVLFCVVTAFAYPSSKNGNELTVGVLTDRCPIFYCEHGSNEIVGIGVDLMRFCAENAGYSVTFRQVEEKTLKDALDSAEYDVVMPFGSAVSTSSGKPTIVSDNLMQMPFTLVTKGRKSITDISSMRIGMLYANLGVSETVKHMHPDMEISFYDTIDDSVKALRAGKVDALLNNSFYWSYILQKPSYSDLTVNPSAMFSMDFRVGATDTPENRALIDQLNKGIAKLTDTRCDAIVLDYSSRRLYQYDFFDYLYQYWVSILLVILLMASILTITIQRRNALRKEHEEKLRRLVNEDTLTCALSLHGFRKRVTKLLQKNPDLPYLILYTNISNFKYINDSVGMEAGDEMLRFMAKKTSEVLTEDEAMCRLEGDHFAILRCIRDEDMLRREYKEVVGSLHTFFEEHGQENFVRVYGGVYVLTPSDYERINVDHMIDLAREAEKKARMSARKEGFEILNHEQWVKGKRNTEMISHLPVALQSGEIRVWYQPKVDYSTGKIYGAEALCRWQHPELGWISPGEFIPVLEEAGLIRELDSFVWERVCKDLKKWKEQGRCVSISVNLSRSDIGEDINIAEYFCNLVHKYDLTPDQLKIEITETVFTEDPRILVDTTRDLKAAGFIVEMDDFGSGYSSLNILKDVPVDVIKLDLLFLRKSDYPEKSRTIISHIINMVRDLGMEMIAEGIETKEQAEFLSQRGCMKMQGYYFYKPMSIEDFEDALKKNM